MKKNKRLVHIIKRGNSVQLYFYNPMGKRRRISGGKDIKVACRLANRFGWWLKSGKDPESELEKSNNKKIGKFYESCLSDCLAYILGVSIDVVPKYQTKHNDPNWLQEINEQLFKFDIFLLTASSKYSDGKNYLPPPELYCIALGHSDRGFRHAVVWHGGQAIFLPNNVPLVEKYPDTFCFIVPFRQEMELVVRNSGVTK